MKTVALVVLATSVLASGAMAAPKAAAVPSDPNRMICRAQELTGSRLKAAKVCMTAQQWAEQKALDREAIEKVQAARYKSQ